MSTEQYMIFSLIAVMLLFFVWGKWRYDVVALATLLLAGLSGLVPVEEVFDGFSNPAVITVAAVLVVSKGLENAGVVEVIAKALNKAGDRPL
ncbi:MAG: SLC13 family permease, partial [Eubacteriales bacterium]|nr:SLC13 family permease [Eubacteriales bacterium]